MSKIRTRFAPSPTGRMHVGNLRTALYAYLIAKHEDGDFLLRIEDTDRERLVEGAVDIIYRTLEKTGLVHDEGPDKDKGFGPYVQSERVASGLYLDYAKELVDKGEAYYCFCSKERLDSLKEGEENAKYDKHCTHLSKEEIESNLAQGKPYVIRQNNPTTGSTTFSDVIFGDITVDNKELDDMVLIKADGYPTYNFANVIDDHLMEISHVVRGNEYLSSSPKYNRLYEAFGWEVPTYVHVPLITDENHKKLSKRSGHSSFEDLVDEGFLNECIVNFIALLGWSPDSNEEVFSLEELVKIFDYKQIKKSPAVFDMGKLRWLNSQYIKNMSEQDFLIKALPYVKEIIKNESLDVKRIALLTKERIETFKEIPSMIDFFESVGEFSSELYFHKRMKSDKHKAYDYLTKLLPVIESLEDFSLLHDEVMAFVKENSLKNGQVLWPLRTILSGKPSTPCGAFDIAEIIGKDETVKRIKSGLESLKQELEK